MKNLTLTLSFLASVVDGTRHQSDVLPKSSQDSFNSSFSCNNSRTGGRFVEGLTFLPLLLLISAMVCLPRNTNKDYGLAQSRTQVSSI